MAFALAMAVAAPAIAGNGGGGGGQLTTSIALNTGATAFATTASGPMVTGAATFNVSRSYPYYKDTIYVTNKCWDASGALVVNLAVQAMWGAWDSLSGSSGPMPTGGTHCTAYVTIKGQQQGSALHYGVG